MKKLALLFSLVLVVCTSLDAEAQRRRSRLDPREDGRTTREDRRERGDRDLRRDERALRGTRVPVSRRLPEYRDTRGTRNTRGGDRGNQR